MSVYTDAQRFVRELDALYAPALDAYQSELQRLLPVLEAQAAAAADRIAAMEAAGESPTAIQLFARERARSIALQVEQAVTGLSARLIAPLDAATGEALLHGVTAAEALIVAQLPEGFPLTFARPNLRALQAALGAQQGAPLGELLGQLGPDAGRLVRDKLNAGLVAGKNPRVIARDMRQVADLTAARADAIARTETLRAFRVSNLETYQAAGITHYRRIAAKSARTCPACLALDGHEQTSDQMLAVHVNDRCALVPVVEIPGVRQPARESGAEWFARQSEETQRAVLGKGGYEAYAGGTPLSRFAVVSHDRDWGPTVRTATLSEVA